MGLGLEGICKGKEVTGGMQKALWTLRSNRKLLKEGRMNFQQYPACQAGRR